MKDRLDTPSEILEKIWQELGRATKDRHHAWRTPVLASVDVKGEPNARTVVLRQTSAATWQLTFYTDARSPKVNELEIQSTAVLVFWSPRLQWQLRVRARISPQTNTPNVENLWNQVKLTRAASDYLSPIAPGSPLSAEQDGASPLPLETSHFCVLVAEVMEIDWLELSALGHRRIKFAEDSWQWLVP